MSRPLMEETEMKQVLIFCEHCEHRIHFSDLFQRRGNAFYHALCWEVYLLDCIELEQIEGIKAFWQGSSYHASFPPPPSNGERSP